MYNVLILSEDALVRQTIGRHLGNFPAYFHIIGSTSSVKESTEIINEFDVDVLFLDFPFDKMKMLEADFLKARSGMYDLVILSNEDYALDAYGYGASDYILKSQLQERLNRTIAMILDRRNKLWRKVIHDGEQKEHMMSKKIGLFSHNELSFFKISDIIYCKGEGIYTKFFIRDKKPVLVSKNIKEYEYLLPQKYFFRIHKSYLVNLTEISKFVKSEGGYVVMENGDAVPISVRKREFFLQALTELNLDATVTTMRSVYSSFSI